ncbi:MAG: hypothetical protein KBD21_05500, partial [Candidatus Pacebacteria bacterium]|nr:hypothetical protein [Candidatus Paceibacterota bacterium]
LREAQAMGASGKAYPAGAPDTDTERFDKGYGVYMTAETAPADANTKVLLYGGAGDGVDAGGLDDPSEDKYISANLVTTNTLPPGVFVQDITATGPGVCSPPIPKKVSIHTRRGEAQTNIHAGDACSGASEVTITLESSAGDTKTIVVNKVGLIYVN